MVLPCSHSPSVKSVAGNGQGSGRPSEGWNSRGAAPAAVLFAHSFFELLRTQERGQLLLEKKNPVVKTEHKIGKITYIVYASPSERATDTLDKKVKKLLRKDMEQNAESACKQGVS
jgi:hypothetical protein